METNLSNGPSFNEMDFAAMINDINADSPNSAKKVAESVAGSLGYYFLLRPVGAEIMDFLDLVFKSKNFISRPGYDIVIREIYTNRDKFSESQLKDIFSWMVGSFSVGVDKDYAMAACDFIARANSCEDALAIFKAMLGKSNEVSSIEGILLGLDVLRMQSRMASRSTSEVDQITVNAVARLEYLESGS